MMPGKAMELICRDDADTEEKSGGFSNRSLEMKRVIFGAVMGLVVAVMTAGFGAGTASAQDWAKAALAKSPRHGEWVTLKHDGRSVDTFVVYPEVKDKRPVVIVIHEIFGMSDWVQELADEVAAAGYIGFVVGHGAGRRAELVIRGREDDGGGEQAAARSGDGGPECSGGLREEDSGGEREIVCRGILLGRRADVPVRDEPSGFVGGVCVLWAAAR
jgi:hypothetical protein